ncbi:hypothetical protein V412_09620 [Escherichia coli LAU-EC7]|nr:Hypothetical protein WLH_03092 [Escherichia coli O25b:H4]ETE32499.1 hypothetical protein V412_09620 [Escherichia coli LAU-EC7]
MHKSGNIAMLTKFLHKDVKLMLRIFIPTSKGRISRRRYIFSFIFTNLICILLISFFSNAGAGFFVITSTILLHYLVINMNCQRLRDSGFTYIKTYIFSTLVVYIISFIIMVAEHFDCSGNGSMIFLICYFSTFGMLVLAPTDSPRK